MPRVHFVKNARKNIGDVVKKGDSYYWWKFRYGGKRISKTRPRPSQLTQSEYLSVMYSAHESVEDAAGSCDSKEGMAELADALRSAHDDVRSQADEIQDKIGNLENAFPNGCPTLELLNERSEKAEQLADELDSAASEAEGKANEEDDHEAKDDEKIKMAKRIPAPIKIHGGKYYLADKIVQLFPKRYLTYCEPYAGGASVLFKLQPEGHSEVLNDLDGELMNFWKVLSEGRLFVILQRMLLTTPFSEKLFDLANSTKWKIKGTADEMRASLALRFFVLARQSLSGRRDAFAAISTSRVRRGMNEQVSAWLTAIDGLPQVHERLRRVLLLSRPAIKCIENIDHKKTLFYCDPPYLQETRVSKSTYGEFEMTAEQHVELLEALAEIDGKFILSGYQSDLYNSYAKKHKWRRVDFKVPNSAASGKSKRIMTESCWMNYP